MQPRLRPLAWLAAALLASGARAAVWTVTTTNSDAPPARSLSLAQAIRNLADGDSIQFNLPGTGPFYLPTPAGGYPWITNNHVTIDGYSQPGAAPNTNGILAANTAQLLVVLDSRNGNVTPMDYDPGNANTGYGPTEFAVLGVFRGAGVTIQGLSILAPPADQNGQNNYYGIAFARDYAGDASGGRVSGCWIGIAPDRATLSGPTYAVTAFRHRDTDGANPVNIDGVTVGVAKGSTNARGEFNVIVPTALPAILEGGGHGISGNFLNVLPDGVTEYNVALDTLNFSQNAQAQGMIQIGRDGDGTVIGVDGDGVNDADERNVMAGTLPADMNGYAHSIEFYGTADGARIIVAGNYLGLAVDGRTRFTNGVPVLSASGAAEYQVGSNLDGLSDDLEGNHFANNWPLDFFLGEFAGRDPATLGFFDGLPLNTDPLAPSNLVSVRANCLIDNFSFPVSPAETDNAANGLLVLDYYTLALVNPAQGAAPVLDPASTTARLAGTVPPAVWSPTYIDLYLADPEGLTNGLFLAAVGITNGWVQGRTYLGSFQVDGPADLDPATNAFSFDIRSLGLPAGATVTVTANYTPPAPVAGPAGLPLTSPFANPVALMLPVDTVVPKLTITRMSGQLILSWSSTDPTYRLQTTTNLAGVEWEDVDGGITQPAAVVAGPGARFFRVKN